jgi:hypothetical protein
MRRLGRALRIVAASLAVASSGAGHFAEGYGRPARGRHAAPTPDLLSALAPSETAWLSGFDRYRRLRLAPAPTLEAIGRYQHPWENHTPEWRAFFSGRYGFESAPVPLLTWRLDEALMPLALPVVMTRPCPRWKAPKPLTVARYAGETVRVPLFDCDGAIAADVIDQLSVLARAPDSPRPELPLPDSARGDEPGEWLPGLRLLDPRLVWVLGELQAAFPGHRVVIMSGYRPHAHTSFHQRGKALDLYVDGVENEALFAVCRTLRDVGCGFYPNNHFVHLDVRAYGTGKVTWVDVSEPGGVSRYVDGWPGVLAPGAGWLGKDASL